MALRDDLEKLKAEQETLGARVGELLKNSTEIASLDERHELLAEVAKLREKIALLEKESAERERENQKLRFSLKEQIVDEKLNLIKASEKKLLLYFGKARESQQNALGALEHEMRGKIERWQKELSFRLGEEKAALEDELAQLTKKAGEIITKLDAQRDPEGKSLKEQIKAELELFRQKPVDEKTVEKRIKQNKLEMKIGLSWLNKIGVVLLLIGIGVAARYSMGFFNDYLKGGLFFCAGVLLLFLGDGSYRKNQDLFSKGLIGAGLAVLYSSLFYSHYGLYIISVEMGLFLSVLVTALTIVLSFRYQAGIILSYALIGGFLPVITFTLNNGLNETGLYVVMGYLFILNAVVLILSYFRQWSLNFILSFCLNFPALVLVVLEVSPVWLGILYTLLTFALYLAVILLYPLRKKEALGWPGLVLLGLNTTLSALLIFYLFDKLELIYLKGYIALGYCLIYYAIAELVRRKSTRAGNSVILFYLTSLTFALLMIPFQFGAQWLVIGWLLEGAFLAVFGYLYKNRAMERAGWVIFALCFLIFYFFDVRLAVVLGEVHFVAALFLIVGMLLLAFSRERKSLLMRWGGLLLIFLVLFSVVYHSLSGYYGLFSWGQLNFKYTLLTGVFIGLFTFLEKRRRMENWGFFEHRTRLLGVVKPVLLLHTILYINYIVAYFFNAWFLAPRGLVYFENDQGFFYFFLPLTLLALLCGIVLRKGTLFQDRFSRMLAMVLSVAGNLFYILLLVGTPMGDVFEERAGLFWIFYLIFVFLNGLMLYDLRYLLLGAFRRFALNLEIYPVWFFLALLLSLLLQLTVHWDVPFNSLGVSFLLLAMAILMIVYGFWRNFMLVRLSGLVLVVLSLAKLFLWDLADLSVSGKILAYLGFGVLLLALSYIYQRVDRLLRAKDKKGGALEE